MEIKIKRAYDSYSDDDGYLERMIDIIVRHEGTIDEFTGYGILVFFGAPRLLPNHTR